MKTKVGVIGQGFVGTAIREGLSHVFKVETYDKFKEDEFNEIVLQKPRRAF